VGRRRKSFMAARLALKHLFRQITGQHPFVPANQIETVHENSALPRMGGIDSKRAYHCSVSHDKRFAIAVADTRNLGVDVEVIDDKVLNFKNIFMIKSEQEMMRDSTLDQRQAAVRIWSIKEAVAKAAGMRLAEAWERVQVTALHAAQSDFSLAHDKMTALHAVVDDHLFTLVPSRNWSK
jgi:phosphopantetheinyl transferase